MKILLKTAECQKRVISRISVYRENVVIITITIIIVVDDDDDNGDDDNDDDNVGRLWCVVLAKLLYRHKAEQINM